MVNKFTVEDFKYRGKYNNWFWDTKYNPNATIENGLANCTTMAIGLTFINKLPYPVTQIVSASNWNKVLTNGWRCADFGSVKLKVGDIVQWVNNCHVATVIRVENGEAILGCSWYTGEHGVSVYKGQYDTRNVFHSLEELSNFMIKNYPFRMYHETTIAEESNNVGGLPEYVLVSPEVLRPVEENRSKNQIHVLTNEQNVRDKNLNIIGIAQAGFYDVRSSFESNGYTWYEVVKGKYIAGVKDRVVYIPADDEFEKLKKENEELKTKLDEINKLSKL